MAVFYISW